MCVIRKHEMECHVLTTVSLQKCPVKRVGWVQGREGDRAGDRGRATYPRGSQECHPT